MNNTPMRAHVHGAWSRFRTALPLLAVLGASCGKDAETQRSAQAKAPPSPKVVVAEVATQTIPVVRELVARTEAVETVEIQARVEAILEKMEFEEGQRVSKDQVLYRLDERTFAAELAVAQARLAQAQANLQLAQDQVSVRAAEAGVVSARATLKKAKQDVARIRPLAEKDAVPRQDLDTSIAAEDVARANLQAEEARLTNSVIQEKVGILLATAEVKAAQGSLDLAKLNVEYCTIRSPLDGLIGRTEVSVGNLVGRLRPTTLATVSSIDPIYVTFAISEEEYLHFSTKKERREEGKRDEVHLILADNSVFPHAGEVVMAGRAVAEQTGTLQIVAAVPNPNGALRPGQFGRARVSVGVLKDALLIPQRAVMERQSTKIVFVVGTGNKVAQRTVQVTERFKGKFVVSDGLAAGDRVIIEGQLKARPGMTVTPMDKAATSEPER